MHEAETMLDLFTSVGAHSFDVTFTDVLGNKAQHDGYFGKRIVPSMRFNLPKWTRRAADLEAVKVDENRTVMAGLNLIMRPHDLPNVKFVQLDDLTDIERVKNVAFMIIQTSPGNHQAWLAVEGADRDFIRRLRKGTGADQTASGATRVAGTQNFKVKYASYYPVITITHGAPARIVMADVLQHLGLVAPEEKLKEAVVRSIPVRPGKKWPSYEQFLQSVPTKRNGDGPDVSIADWRFC